MTEDTHLLFVTVGACIFERCVGSCPRHFVNALKGAADKNRDAKVTLQEADAYAYQPLGELRSEGTDPRRILFHAQHRSCLPAVSDLRVAPWAG